MKIALLGNMNNNNFALLRYFRDLGVEADLLLMLDDGVDNLSHFSPESDTWDIGKWSAYIKQLAAPNRFISAIGNEFPWNILFWARFVLYIGPWKARSAMRPIDKKVTLAQLEGYDYYIGSGITPALLDSIGIPLDVFYPYSAGVEWFSAENMRHMLSSGGAPLYRRTARRVMEKQISGIKKARLVFSSDYGYTFSALRSIGIKPYFLQIPMVYLENTPPRLPAVRVGVAWGVGRMGGGAHTR